MSNIINTTTAKWLVELEAQDGIHLGSRDGGMYGQCIHMFCLYGKVYQVSGYNSTSGHRTITGEPEEIQWSDTCYESEVDYHLQCVDSLRNGLNAESRTIKHWLGLAKEGKTHTRGLSLESFKESIQSHITHWHKRCEESTAKAAVHRQRLEELS